jgi:hypothetical protein
MRTRINQSESESEKTECWGTNSQTPVLRVELPDGSFHLFPYSLLVKAQFSPTDRKDCLTLTFDSHSICITGTNLKKLGLAFQQLTVEWIKESVKNTMPLKSANCDHIESIKIAESAT